MIFLGIDTSCYTTSCAAVNEFGEIVFDNRIPLEVKPGECGLRQSDMVFQHIKNIKNTAQYAGDIAAVAASESPRPADGSYMPVFVVSGSVGRFMAEMMGSKYYPLTHQHGHIGAALIGNSYEGGLLALHVSGGTTEILSANVTNGVISGIELIGGTKDISAGQMIDRLANKMGMPFPGGEHLEREAASGRIMRQKICVRGLHVNLSGMDTSLERMIGKEKNSDIAISALDGIARTLTALIDNAASETGIKTALLMGGVMRNKYIREYIVKNSTCNIMLSEINYSSDNACGLAMQARAKYLKENGDKNEG